MNTDRKWMISKTKKKKNVKLLSFLVHRGDSCFSPCYSNRFCLVCSLCQRDSLKCPIRKALLFLIISNPEQITYISPSTVSPTQSPILPCLFWHLLRKQCVRNQLALFFRSRGSMNKMIVMHENLRSISSIKSQAWRHTLETEVGSTEARRLAGQTYLVNSRSQWETISKHKVDGS